MQDVLTLQDLPMGQMGEIVDLTEEHRQAIYQEFGASVGMTVMILPLLFRSSVKCNH